MIKTDLKKNGIAILFLLGWSISYGQAEEHYKPNWTSLEKHQEVPEWMRDAKFGIYVHWGVYSVPAYNNEHYYSHMHNLNEYAKMGTHKRHVVVYGPLSEFGYHDFIPMFTGENFDANRWASLFAKGGARFAGLVAEHHDGFAMWDSEWTPFNAMDMGPHRDITGELGKAIHDRNIKFFASLHHSLNYTYVKPKPEWEASDPKYAKLYGSPMPRNKWLDMWLSKSKEVVDRYHPDIMYFDSWLNDIPEQYVRDYLAHYFNEARKRDQDVIVTYKGEDLPDNVGMLDHENSNPKRIIDKPWLSDMPIGTGASYSWGYTSAMEIRTPKEIIHKIIEVVSKNGQLLLNLSPKADGTIPQNQRNVVHRVGQWMWSFGESIYGTRPFSVYGETTDEGFEVYYTRKGDTVYAIFLEWPGAGTPIHLEGLNQKNLDGELKEVEMLGLKKIEDASFKKMKEGIELTVPDARIPDEHAIVFRFQKE